MRAVASLIAVALIGACHDSGPDRDKIAELEMQLVKVTKEHEVLLTEHTALKAHAMATATISVAEREPLLLSTVLRATTAATTVADLRAAIGPPDAQADFNWALPPTGEVRRLTTHLTSTGALEKIEVLLSGNDDADKASAIKTLGQLGASLQPRDEDDDVSVIGNWRYASVTLWMYYDEGGLFIAWAPTKPLSAHTEKPADDKAATIKALKIAETAGVTNEQIEADPTRFSGSFFRRTMCCSGATTFLGYRRTLCYWRYDDSPDLESQVSVRLTPENDQQMAASTAGERYCKYVIDATLVYDGKPPRSGGSSVEMTINTLHTVEPGT